MLDALKDPNLNLAGDNVAENNAIKDNEQTTRLIQTNNAATSKKSLSTGLSIFFSSTANMGISTATWSVAKKYIPNLIAANQFLKGNLGSVAMAISGTVLGSGCDRLLAGLSQTPTQPLTWQETAATIAAVGLVGGTASLIPLSGLAYVLTMSSLEPIAVRYTEKIMQRMIKECSQRFSNTCNKRNEETSYQQFRPGATISI